MEPSARIAITGPDGSGKSTTTRLVARQLGLDYDLIQPGPSRPAYAVMKGKLTYPFDSTLQWIHRLHHFADWTRRPAIIGCVNAFNVLFCARIVRPVLMRRFKPELVLAARDFRVDPSVYSSIYLPVARSWSMRRRIDFTGKITRVPYNDIIFFLTVPPEEAIRRIDARIAAERKEPDLKLATRSWRWRHLHENPATLAFLQQEFYRGFWALQQRCRVLLFEIDTAGLAQPDVVDFIVRTTRAFIQAGPNAVSTWPRWTKHSALGTETRSSRD